MTDQCPRESEDPSEIDGRGLHHLYVSYLNVTGNYCCQDGCCRNLCDRTVRSQDDGHPGDLTGSYCDVHDGSDNLMNGRLCHDDMHDWTNTLAGHC